MNVDAIMDYESGELDADGIVSLFGDLVASGAAWSLQGHYGRTAASLIDAGWIDRSGQVLQIPSEVL